MMATEIWLGENSDAYYVQITQLVTTYNQISRFATQPTIEHPENTALIKVVGVDGGIFLDKHDQGFWRIMLAAFPEAEQGKGHLTRCLKAAFDAGLDIQVVEVDMGEQAALWEKLGFSEKGIMGLMMVRHKPEMHEKYGLERKQSEGLDIQEVFKHLIKQRQRKDNAPR